MKPQPCRWIWFMKKIFSNSHQACKVCQCIRKNVSSIEMDTNSLDNVGELTHMSSVLYQIPQPKAATSKKNGCFQQKYQANLIAFVQEISTMFIFDLAILHQTSICFPSIVCSLPFSLNTTAIYGASKKSLGDPLKMNGTSFRLLKQKNTQEKLHNYRHQGHCCARSRVFCTWEPGVSAASRARKMLIRWSMSSRFLGAWAVNGDRPRGIGWRGKWLLSGWGFNFTLMVEKDSNKKRKDVGVLFCFWSCLCQIQVQLVMIRMLFVVPKEWFFMIEKYSWNTHIIHGNGIFTYMDGWFLWFSFR